MKNKIMIILFSIITYCMIFINCLCAQEYSIIQITNNNCADRIPKIDNGQIVWEAYIGSGRNGVFLYNGLNLIQLAENNSMPFNFNPQIHNGQVAWMAGSSDNHNIFLYNGTRVIQLTNDTYDNTNPQIYNGQVVWKTYDGYDYKLFLYDGSNVIHLADNVYSASRAQIHNGQVVWQGYDGHDTEIFLYNGITNLQLTNNGSEDQDPQIYNGQVTWEENGDIFLYNGSTIVQLTQRTSDARYYRLPKIHNGQVVWVRSGDYSNHDEIYLYNGAGIIQLSNKAYDADPQIYDGKIAWREHDGSEIFLYNGASIMQLTNQASIYARPKIHNGQVIWIGFDGLKNKLFIYNGSGVIQLTDNVYIDIGSDPQIHNGQVSWINWDGQDYEIFLATPNDGSILNMTQMPWRQNAAPYNSTGAAACQMILDYIREGAGQMLLSQNAIYEYAKSPQAFGPNLNPDEIDKVLGHFDPYDTLVSNWADSYDTLADGNPYQGYNYSVDTYDPKKDPEAMNKYMRDICHWMAYPVTKEDWWKDGELVARPNTPAVIPIYGTYDHWVVVKGYAASKNPCPEPHTNPRNTPDFTVYGFWFKDPLVNGIGQDTYKSAAECKATYFLPLTIAGAYNGLLLQVAEPPAEISRANAKIEVSSKDLANLQFVGVKTEVSGNKNGAVAMLSESAMGLERKPPTEKIKKQSWRDLVDKRILADSEAVSAFKDAVMARPILVKRADKLNSDYYLVPFNKTMRGKGALTSAVIVLDANSGFFKEASWTKKPELFLGVDRNKAIGLVLANVLRNRQDELRRLAYVPRKEYAKQMDIIIRKYAKLINYIQNAKAELMWQPKGYSSSPYKPYWKVDANGYIWYVTQEGKIVPEVELKRILNEIERNIGLITNIRYTSTR